MTATARAVPLELPYASLDNKQFFYRLVRDAIRDSALILTVSECSKRDILEFFNVEEDQVVVTYQALPETAIRDERRDEVLLERFKITSKQYVLFVGNIEPKKNVASLFQAMGTLKYDLPVVVVGQKAWLWKEQLKVAEEYFGPVAREVEESFRCRGGRRVRSTRAVLPE